MTPPLVVSLALALLSLLGAAFFTAARTAFSRISLNRAKRLATAHPRGGGRVLALVERPARTANTLALLVVTLTVTGAAWLTVAIDQLVDGYSAVVVASGVAAATLFVGAEVAPKTLALQRTEFVARITARWVQICAAPLAPVARLLIALGDLIAPGKRLEGGPFVTEAELRDLIDTAESESVIESAEARLIHRVFELGDTVVREIMVPRTDMTTVAVTQPLGEVVDLILSAGHSRIPIRSGDGDGIVGLVYAKDVLRRLHQPGGDALPWTDLIRPPHFVPELVNVDQLLRDMQKRKVHLSIVVDEYGETAGLVTIEDVLEEIVGEIADEYDREEPLVVDLSSRSWRVDARLPVASLAELVGGELPEGDWDSVGGLFFGVLGRVPRPGQTVHAGPAQLTAERIEGRRIRTVRVDLLDRARAGTPR